LKTCLNNFSIFINPIKVDCNRDFACLISDEIFNQIKSDSSISSFRFTCDSTIEKCFHDVTQLAQGFSIDFNKFDLLLFHQVFDILKFSSAQQFLSSLAAAPSSIKESLLFLQKPNCQFFKNHYHTAILIVAQSFYKLDFNSICPLSLPTLNDIFSSNKFMIQNETWLLLVVVLLSKHNPLNKALLSKVQFSHVQSEVLKTFLHSISIDDVDFFI
jgi:hypothetical protein